MALVVRPGAGDQFTLRLEIGALGADRRTQEWSYRTMAEALDRMREVVEEQLHNGFRIATMSQRHPLREWLGSKQVRGDADKELTLF